MPKSHHSQKKSPFSPPHGGNGPLLPYNPTFLQSDQSDVTDDLANPVFNPANPIAQLYSDSSILRRRSPPILSGLSNEKTSAAGGVPYLCLTAPDSDSDLDQEQIAPSNSQTYSDERQSSGNYGNLRSDSYEHYPFSSPSPSPSHSAAFSSSMMRSSPSSSNVENEDDQENQSKLNCWLWILLTLALLDGKIGTGGILRDVNGDVGLVMDTKTLLPAPFSLGAMGILFYHGLVNREGIQPGCWAKLSLILTICVLVVDGLIDYKNNHSLFKNVNNISLEDNLSFAFAAFNVIVLGLIRHNLFNLKKLYENLVKKPEVPGKYCLHIARVLLAFGITLPMRAYAEFRRVSQVESLSLGGDTWIIPPSLSIGAGILLASFIGLDSLSNITKNSLDYANSGREADVSAITCGSRGKQFLSLITTGALVSSIIYAESQLLLEDKYLEPLIGLSATFIAGRAAGIFFVEGPIIYQYVNRLVKFIFRC